MKTSRRTILGSLLVGAVGLPACQSAVVANAPLATGQQGVEALGSDAFHVYFVLSTGELKRVPLDGGPIESLFTGKAGPQSLVLDEAYAYLATGDGTIHRVAKKDGSSQPLAVEVAVHDLAVDDAHLYFIAGDSVKSVTKDASPATPSSVLAGGQLSPRALALRGALLWASEGTSAAAGSGASVAPDGSVAQVPIGGGAPVALVSQISPHAFAVTAQHLAWTEVAQGLVRIAPVEGGDIVELAQIDPTVKLDRTGKPELLAHVVADATHAYFSTDQGVVRRVGLAAGSPAEVLLEGAPGAVRLSLDATALYVANPGDGAILALPLG